MKQCKMTRVLVLRAGRPLERGRSPYVQRQRRYARTSFAFGAEEALGVGDVVRGEVDSAGVTITSMFGCSS